MNQFFDSDVSDQRKQDFITRGGANAFMRQVYTIMSLGLAITAAAAWFVSDVLAVDQYWYDIFMRYYIIIALSPVIFVFIIGSQLNKVSYSTASILFGVYAALNGLAFSPIILIYTSTSIFKTFLITGGTFGAMSIIGMTTSIDLSKYRSILFMAVIGLLIALVVNMFTQSTMMDYIISGAGVLIFSALTAYDTQRLIEIGAHADPEHETTQKIAIYGALKLYLDFINLFLFLLRFIGVRR